MSRFLAVIEGQAGRSSRIVASNSGVRGHIRGWNVGVQVSGSADGPDDVFHIYATRGSNGAGQGFLIGVLRTEESDRLVFEPSPEALGERGGYVKQVA